MQLLKRRRKKLNLVEKLAGIYKSPGWRGVEDRVLALVQLWADTFMMQEDAYPAFMRAYRELRKEGLKFPPRDPNERFMIKFEGEPSPAFELADMEQNTVKVEARESRDGRKIRENRGESRGQAQEEEPRLLESDVTALKEGLEALEDLLCSARDVRELQEPRAKDYIRKCRGGQKKLMWVVSYKTEMADEDSVMQLISIMEFVNNKMENFKKAAGILKRGGSSAEIQEILKGSEKKKSGPTDLLDLGEDFLEIADANPLDGLEKFVYGREVRKEAPREAVQKVNARVEEEKKEVIKEEEVTKSPKRLEQPNLLFDEIEPSPQMHNLMDLNSLEIGPPGMQTANPGYAAYNPNPNFPTYNPNPSVPAYNQNPSFPAYNPNPQVLKAQPSGDDFEDFFSDLANRRAY